jgi:hypothetical protein
MAVNSASIGFGQGFGGGRKLGQSSPGDAEHVDPGRGAFDPWPATTGVDHECVDLVWTLDSFRSSGFRFFCCHHGCDGCATRNFMSSDVFRFRWLSVKFSERVGCC